MRDKWLAARKKTVKRIEMRLIRAIRLLFIASTVSLINPFYLFSEGVGFVYCLSKHRFPY